MQAPKCSHEAYRIDERGRKTNLWRSTPGIASEFIHHLSALIERDSKLPTLVLHCRASTKGQEKNGNLNDQMMDALRKLLKMGFRLGRDIIVFEGVESSRIGSENEDRPLLEQALDEARKRGLSLLPPIAIGSCGIGISAQNGHMSNRQFVTTWTLCVWPVMCH